MSLWKKLKQQISLNAYYDAQTDTIHNCTPYTYTWFHERRHQQQFKRARFITSINKWTYIIGYALGSGAFFIAYLTNFTRWDLVFGLIGFAWLPHTMVNMILELDAFIFGTLEWVKYILKKS